MAGISLLAACHDTGSVKRPGGDAAADLSRDITPLDGPAADRAAPDLPADRGLPDLPEPDGAAPDSAVPDLPGADQAAPDLPAPDQASPDLVVPDAQLPDGPPPKPSCKTGRVCSAHGWCWDQPRTGEFTRRALHGTGAGTLYMVGDGGVILKYDGKAWAAMD